MKSAPTIIIIFAGLLGYIEYVSNKEKKEYKKENLIQKKYDRLYPDSKCPKHKVEMNRINAYVEYGFSTEKYFKQQKMAKKKFPFYFRWFRPELNPTDVERIQIWVCEKCDKDYKKWKKQKKSGF